MPAWLRNARVKDWLEWAALFAFLGVCVLLMEISDWLLGDGWTTIILLSCVAIFGLALFLRAAAGRGLRG